MRYIISPSLASAIAFCAGIAQAEVPQVVTDVPVVHSLVSMVLGELGEAELLLTPGGSEHHFQLRPSQATGIVRADLVVHIGPELTPWLDSALALRPEGAPALSLLHTKGTVLREYGEEAGGDHDGEHEDGEDAHADAHDHNHGDGHDHGHKDNHAEAGDHKTPEPEHGQEQAHAHGHGHDEKQDDAHGHKDEHEHKDEHGHEDEHGHDHSHDGIDPHAWLDPGNAQNWLALIAAELARLDPENAATYSANAEAGALAIREADTKARATLTPVAERPFATFHDAWGYYTAHYQITQAGSVALGDAATPGAKRLEALRAKVESGAVICLFPEVGTDPAPLERVAEATGVKIGAILDPVGAGAKPGAELYPLLLTDTATKLAECLAP